MPHLKCETCRTRFRTDDRLVSDVGDARCPGCNSLLESPSQLAELVGFQRSRFEDLLPGDNSDFLEAVAIALARPRPGTER
jgi:hypothetical protein